MRRRIFGFCVVLFSIAGVAAAAPPSITSVSNTVIDAGGPYFLMTVNGSGFVSDSVVNWSGSPQSTIFVSSTQLKAAITTDLRAYSGTFNLTVANPDGAVSNSYAITVMPVLATITPAAVLAGSAAVTITATGIGFIRREVLVLNVPNQQTALISTYIDSATLTAVVPASALSVARAATIQVLDPLYGDASGALAFQIWAAPVITSAAPNTFDAGGPYFMITVTGTGFVAGSVVNWPGAPPLGTAFVSSTQLQAAITPEIRSASGTFNLTVSDPIGAASNPYAITVSPVLFTISPASAVTAGPAVAITATGLGFTRNNVLALNVAGQQSQLATTYVSSTTLTAAIPAGALRVAGSASVQVIDSAGAGRSLTQPFTILPGAAITSLNPSTATAGAAAFTLTVNGTNFTSGGVVLWNGWLLATTFVSVTQLTASVPAALVQAVGAAGITVSNPGGAVSNSLTFAINPPPTLTSLSPSTATAGAAAFTLTVNGTNFVPGVVVLWNGSPLATTFVSATQLAAYAPASLFNSALAAAVTVASPGGAASNSLTFTVNPVRPTIAALSPASAMAGTASFTLTATGLNFAINCVLRWNGSPLWTTFLSATQATAAVPADLVAAPGAGAVTLINPSGLISNAATFTVNTPAPTIASISPASAPAGGPALVLAVSGTNFLSSSTVLWNGSPLATTVLSASQLTASVPASLIAAAGAASIAVAIPGASSNTLAFTVSPPLPAATTAGIVNAANGLVSIAPGSLISIYGVNLAAGTAAAPSTPLPNSLNGTSVTIDGSPAPLLFVSSAQINAQAPFETKAGTATLLIQAGAVKSAPITFTVIETAPGVLTTSGSNHAIAQNYPDGALNSPQNPARPGQYVVVYLTGQGQVDPQVATGAAAPANPLSLPLASIQAQVGGKDARISFMGLAPGFVGLSQMNIVIPDVADGEQPLDVSIGGVPANSTVLSVKADR